MLGPGEQRVDRPYRLGLLGDHVAVDRITQRAHPLGRTTHPCALLLGRRLPLALAHDLGAGNLDLDARGEQAVLVRQVHVPRHGLEQEPARAGGVDPVLQLPGLTGEPVEVPADDRIEHASLVVGDHAVVARPLLRGVRGADGLIDVGLDDGPALALGEAFAVLALALDGEAVHLQVQADAQVDRRAARRRGEVVLHRPILLLRR